MQTSSDDTQAEAPSPVGFALGRGTDVVDGQIGAVEFLLLAQTQAHGLLEQAVDQQAAQRGPGHAHQRAYELGQRMHAAKPAQCLRAEDAGRNAAPGAAQTVQRPHTQHIVDLPFVLGQSEHEYKDGAGGRQK